MSRRARTRIALATMLTAVAAGGVATALMWSCSSFDAGEETGDEGGPGDSSIGVDVVPASDAAANDTGADAADAAPRIIVCGVAEKCIVGQQECCIFWRDSTEFTTFCADGACPATKMRDGGGLYEKTVLQCDDPTDCEPGQVCCLLRNACTASAGYKGGECRAPVNCPSCSDDVDSGVGVHACRTSITTDCDAGQTCTGTPPGYPFFAPYKFCKKP
jgi:hypothetical protein